MYKKKKTKNCATFMHWNTTQPLIKNLSFTTAWNLFHVESTEQNMLTNKIES